MEALIDWESVARVVSSVYSSAAGRPAYPPRVMVKAAMLAQWYHLGDPGLEEALADRLSFRRYCGLSPDEPPPDHVTIWRFRNELGKRGLAEVNRQLEGRGLVGKRGTLLDATLVKAQARPLRGGARCQVDPDAAWTRQGGPYHFGYKAHVAVDRGSGSAAPCNCSGLWPE